LSTQLVQRLLGRRVELEGEILARVYSVDNPSEAGDPEYVQGLRTAVAAALSYGLTTLEGRVGRPEPIPVELLMQARQAARCGVGLDTVLRRYFAGYTLLQSFVAREVDGERFQGELDLHLLARVQAAAFDRLVDAIATEYRRAVEEQARLFRRRRSDCVERLLAGELVDEAELGYDLEAWHVAAVGSGRGFEEVVREWARSADRRLLLVQRGNDVAWAWLGGRRRIAAAEIGEFMAGDRVGGLSISLGEPGSGAGGWRVSHRQAVAALPIAIRTPGAITRYNEVCLLASVLQDEVLVRSLEQLYLAPLASDRDGGETLRSTLRAYFTVDGNVSSTAAALEVSRQTVTNRLHTVEQRLGKPLRSCAREMETALHLADLRWSAS